MKPTLRIIVLAAFAALLVGCRSSDRTAAELATRLQRLVDETVSGNEDVPGAALHVDAPRVGLQWEGSAGAADPAADHAPMTPAHPVLVASNTKTFVSASILRLWEQGTLGLDDPIVDHLSGEHVEILRGGGYRSDVITIRHLLTHTSGLFDYAMSEDYEQAIMADPGHRWSRTEQLEAAMEWGDPYGEPGEVFHYSDTGYILLGEIIERTAGGTMWSGVRDLVGYDEIGLHSTWFFTLEPKPEGVVELAHQFYGEIDVVHIDPSVDLYGGGGLASTVGDLARFMRGVFTGGVYTRTGTVETMLTTVPPAPSGFEGHDRPPAPRSYRMGVSVVEVEGVDVYLHSGFYGTMAAYVPELDVAIAATVNQTYAEGALTQLYRSALAAVRDAQE